MNFIKRIACECYINCRSEGHPGMSKSKYAIYGEYMPEIDVEAGE